MTLAAVTYKAMILLLSIQSLFGVATFVCEGLVLGPCLVLWFVVRSVSLLTWVVCSL